MQRRLETDLPPGGSIGDLIEMLDVKLAPDAMIFLVNGRPQREEYLLEDGDEVNLIPAMYGGA
jgi:molybdopterin converting factor small subunit